MEKWKMKLKYVLNNGEEITAYFLKKLFCGDDDIIGSISIYNRNISYWDDISSVSRVPVTRSVRRDENGSIYFTYDNIRYDFLDFVCPTPKEFCDNITEFKGKNYDESTLSAVLIKYGLDSIQVIKKIEHGYDSDLIEIPYKFVNEDFSDPMENYKLKLVPANKHDYGVYPSIRTYTSDLVNLFRNCDYEYKLTPNC